MRMKNDYEWAQNQIDRVTHMTKEQRNSQACQRRLRQMEAKRMKDAARKNTLVTLPKTGG